LVEAGEQVQEVLLEALVCTSRLELPDWLAQTDHSNVKRQYLRIRFFPNAYIELQRQKGN